MSRNERAAKSFERAKLSRDDETPKASRTTASSAPSPFIRQEPHRSATARNRAHRARTALLFAVLLGVNDCDAGEIQHPPFFHSGSLHSLRSFREPLAQKIWTKKAARKPHER